jgi:RNA polymerase sigma-32 factor
MAGVPPTVRVTRRMDAAEELALFEQWQDRGQGRAQILESSLWLVALIAREFRCMESDRADLIAEGHLALLMAFDRFDPSRGVRFTTYARPWVSAAMKSYLGRSQNALGSRAYARMNAKLRRETRFDPGSREDGPEGNGSALRGGWGGRDVSLDAPIAGDGPTTLLDCLASDWMDVETAMMSHRQKASVRAAVEEARSTFDAREQVIFDIRFMTDEGDDEPTTLDAAAKKLGLSRERVRQLEERVRCKLVDGLRHALPDGYETGSTPRPASSVASCEGRRGRPWDRAPDGALGNSAQSANAAYPICADSA